MHTRLSRAGVPVESTWNLGDLFVDETAWEAEYQAVDEARRALSAYQGQLSDGAAELLACLDAVESVQARVMRVATFAHLRNAQDGTNPQYQAAMARVSALQARVGASMAFVDSEILAFPDGLLEQFMASEPGLAAFRRMLNDLLELRPHRLGADTERVLASLGEVLNAPYMIYSRSKSSDMQFAPFTDAAGTVYAEFGQRLRVELRDPQRHERAARRLGLVQRRAEGLQPHLRRHLRDRGQQEHRDGAAARLPQHRRVPAAAAQDPARRSTATSWTSSRPSWRRTCGATPGCAAACWAWTSCCTATSRRRWTRLRPAHVVRGRLRPDPGCARRDGAGVLRLRAQGLEQRWIDRADNIGKSSGAFCASPYGVHPYILITWSDTMRNVFTLAHELGHGGHFGLAMQHQRFVNTRPAMPFVEAPSIMNEMLLAQHILGRSQDRAHAALGA